MELLSFLLSLGGIPALLIGLITIFHWFTKPKPPMDISNRLNKVLFWWIALRHPEDYVDKHEWMKRDVKDNFKNNK